jgi:hypothetical protein
MSPRRVAKSKAKPPATESKRPIDKVESAQKRARDLRFAVMRLTTALWLEGEGDKSLSLAQRERDILHNAALQNLQEELAEARDAMKFIDYQLRLEIYRNMPSDDDEEES